MKKSVFLNCLGEETADRIKLAIRKLRVAGITENQREYECNCCGGGFEGVGSGMVRGNVPVVVCYNCQSDDSVSEMSIEQLEKWERMLYLNNEEV